MWASDRLVQGCTASAVFPVTAVSQVEIDKMQNVMGRGGGEDVGELRGETLLRREVP